MARRCLRYSPLVGLETAPAPTSLFVDITGVAALFGGEAALAKRIVRRAAAGGLTVRAAVADTLGAAWAVTHFGRRKAEGGGRKEKEGRRKTGDCPNFRPTKMGLSPLGPPSALRPPPSALFLVPPGETLAWLRPLPLEALRLSAPVVAVLKQLGVRRVEQLEAIPRGEFSARFGPELLAAWDRATGRLGEPFPAYDPPPQLAARWTPESPTARRETIEAAFQHLARKIAAGLGRSGRGATQLECRLECTAGGPVRLSVGLFQPTARPRYLVDLLRLRFDTARLPGAVRSVHLAVAPTPRWKCGSRSCSPGGRLAETRGIWRD